MPNLTLEQTGEGGRIARLCLQRTQRLNAFDDAMLREVFAALDKIAQSDTQVVILTGSGRGFCAGFDLSAAGERHEDPVANARHWTRRQEHFASLVTRLRALPQPVIAAVNGLACGAGLGLALGCDLRIAGASAQFNAAFIKVGMTSCDIGVSWLLPRAIGSSRAFEMMLTGRMIAAPEAERIGLCHRMTADEDLQSEALALAESIAQNGDLNVSLTKRGAWANLETPSLAAAIELENRSQILMQGTGNLERVAKARGFL